MHNRRNITDKPDRQSNLCVFQFNIRSLTIILSLYYAMPLCLNATKEHKPFWLIWQVPLQYHFITCTEKDLKNIFGYEKRILFHFDQIKFCLDVFAFICNKKNVAVHARANIDTPKKWTWRVTYFHMDEEISLGEIP